MTFGQLLEHLGRIPIPPYLNRESRGDRQYALPDRLFQIRRFGGRADGGAALHTGADRADAGAAVFGFEEVTLHVGAGTFLPVKDRRCRGASDAHRAFRGAACDRRERLLRQAGRVSRRWGRPRCGRSSRSRRWRGVSVLRGFARCRAACRAVGVVRHCPSVFTRAAKRWR